MSGFRASIRVFCWSGHDDELASATSGVQLEGGLLGFRV